MIFARALSRLGIHVLRGQNLSFAKIAGATSLMSAGATIIGLVTSVLLARLLGPEALGIYSAAFALIFFLSVLANSGVPTALITLIAKYQAVSDTALVLGCVRWAYMHVGCAFVVVAALGAMLAFAVGDRNGAVTSVYLVAFACMPLWGLLAVQSGVLQGLDMVVQARAADLIVRPAAFIGLVVALHAADVVPHTQMAALVMAANAVAFAVAATYSGVILQHRLGPLRQGSQPVYRVRRWYRISSAISASEVAQSSMAHSAMILLPLLATASEAGLLRVAVTVSAFVLLPNAAITAAMPSIIARAMAHNEAADLQHVVTFAVRLAFLLALPVGAALALGGQWLLVVAFGTDFAASYLPLIILLVANLATVGAGPSSWLLRLSGNHKNEARVTLLLAALQVVLVVAASPAWGASGAAAAMAAASIARLLILNSLSFKATSVSCSVFGGAGLKLWPAS